jgi:hypothetical protein
MGAAGYPGGVPVLLVAPAHVVTRQCTGWEIVSGSGLALEQVYDLRRRSACAGTRVLVLDADSLDASLWASMMPALEQLHPGAFLVLQVETLLLVPDSVLSRCYRRYLLPDYTAQSYQTHAITLMRAVELEDVRTVFDAKDMDDPLAVQEFVRWLETWASPKFMEFAYDLEKSADKGARPLYVLTVLAMQAIVEHRDLQCT